MWLVDGEHHFIEDTINYSRHWENWRVDDFFGTKNVTSGGFPTKDMTILVPLSDSLVYFVYSIFSTPVPIGIFQ